MKLFGEKIALFILLIFLLIPINVFAEDFEYTIKAKVNINNKDIEEDEFTFQLIDSNGNVIQTKKNDSEGNIIFDPIEFTTDDLSDNGRSQGYKFYRIKQVEIDSFKYKYDLEESYVGVYLKNDGSSIVNYLKNIDEQINKWTYKAEPDESKIYHATDEQLVGQAYAVLDYSDATLIFFRDEPGKYTNNQYIYYDNGTKYKIYFTGFEGDNLYAPWSDYRGIKKIIFNDPIRPKHVANINLSEWGGSVSGSWFYSIDDLEEIENINLLDTSLVDSFNSLFAYNHKLKQLDLSTWDTSNVLDMNHMFAESDLLEEVNVENFDTSKVINMASMFYRTKIKNFDPTLFETDNLRRANEMFWYVDGIQGLDFSSWTVSDWYGTPAIVSTMKQLRFVDISNFKYITSNGIANNEKLTILKMAESYNDFSSSFGDNYAYWFNIVNNTLYNREDLRRHLVELKDLEPATYIRPYDDPNPSIFNNDYIAPIEEKITVALKEGNVNILKSFSNILGVTEETIWKIDDPTIIDIKDGEIIPLLMGETFISTIIEGKIIRIHVIVTDNGFIMSNVANLLKNPETGDIIVMIATLTIISFVFALYLYNKKI